MTDDEYPRWEYFHRFEGDDEWECSWCGMSDEHECHAVNHENALQRLSLYGVFTEDGLCLD